MSDGKYKIYDPSIGLTIMNMKGEEKTIKFPAYLYGLLGALKLRRDHKWHSILLVTGNVGDGKSTLVEGMCAVNDYMEDRTLDFGNVSWSTEKFIEKIDQEDNVGSTQWWDEAIQGAKGRDSLTKLGNKLKLSFVTRRFKRHLYILVLDEVNEFSWKFIKMCDAWIHVKTNVLDRGYYDVFATKWKIKFLYNLFKDGKDWDSRETKKIFPDHKGIFNNYAGQFLDEDEYLKRKEAETKQMEEAAKNEKVIKDKEVAMIIRKVQGKKNVEIAREFGVDPRRVSESLSKFRQLVQDLNLGKTI